MEDDKKTQHEINELEQEKVLLDEINTFLEKNEKISDEIFESFSHELRTPTVTIKSYTDMILDGKFGELTPEQKEKLTRVKENTELLIHVIFKMMEKSEQRK